MSEDKHDNHAMFMAKYGVTDINHELDKEKPNPHVLKRDDVTRQHALKALYHRHSDVSRAAVNTTLLKKSDLTHFLDHQPPNEHYAVDGIWGDRGRQTVRHAVESRFKYDDFVKENSWMSAKKYYPEDKE